MRSGVDDLAWKMVENDKFWLVEERERERTETIINSLCVGLGYTSGSSATS
jgi:hypothetical protein